MKTLLSIVIVTMNRAEQLAQAIGSCLRSNLPSATEFIIIDNGSTDNTSVVIETLRQDSNYPVKYLKLSDNIGAGPGRNLGIQEAAGKYIYGLDDDAIISECNLNFFVDAIKILDTYPQIAAMTTQIYDVVWKDNRIKNIGNEIFNGVFNYFAPCGGSYFLRREYYDFPIFYPNKYGYEELAVAMQAIRKGYLSVFVQDLKVIHNPKVDKWQLKSNRSHYINDFACQYAIKSVFYPILFKPILWLVYQIRYNKYLKGSKLRSQGQEIIKQIYSQSRGIKKIKFKDVLKLYRSFGVTVF